MIILKSIDKKIGKVHLFENLNLQIEERGITWIQGESGSGKTTLLDIMTNRTSYKGNVVIDGKCYPKNTMMTEGKIRYCSSYDTLFSKQSVCDNILFGNKVDKETIECINYYLKRYRIMHLKFEPVSRLSIGQKELVKAIQVMISGADYLLFDEVTASLDRDVSALLMEDLKALSKTSSIVLVSHDPQMKDYADRTVDLDDPEEEKELSEHLMPEQRKSTSKYVPDPIFLAIGRHRLLDICLLILCGFCIFSFMNFSSSNLTPPLEEFHRDEIRLRYGSELSSELLYKAIDEEDVIGIRVARNNFLSRTDEEFTICGYPVAFYQLDSNRMQIFIENSDRSEIVGKHHIRPEKDDEVILSEPLFRYMKNKAEQIGIGEITLEDLTYYNMRVVDTFDSDGYQAVFSENSYVSFRKRKGRKEVDFNISYREDETSTVDYEWTSDLSNNEYFLRRLSDFMDRSHESWKGRAIEGKTNEFICYREEIYNGMRKSFTSDLRYDYYCYKKYDGIPLTEGRIPEKENEVIVPDSVRRLVPELTSIVESDYQIVGYYEHPYDFCDNMTAYTASSKTVMKRNFSNSSYKDIIIRTGDPKGLKEFFRINNVLFDMYDDAYGNWFMDEHGKMLISFGVSVLAIDALYVLFIYLQNKDYYAKSQISGIDSRGLSLYEMKNTIRNLSVSWILFIGCLWILYVIFDLLYGLPSLMYGIFAIHLGCVLLFNFLSGGIICLSIRRTFRWR